MIIIWIIKVLITILIKILWIFQKDDPMTKSTFFSTFFYLLLKLRVRLFSVLNFFSYNGAGYLKNFHVITLRYLPYMLKGQLYIGSTGDGSWYNFWGMRIGEARMNEAKFWLGWSKWGSISASWEWVGLKFSLVVTRFITTPIQSTSRCPSLIQLKRNLKNNTLKQPASLIHPLAIILLRIV